MYTCQYCSKECKSNRSKIAHERFCKLNPNYETNIQHHIETVSIKGARAFTRVIKEKALNDPLNQIKTYNLICSKCGKAYQLDIKVRLYERGCYKKTCSIKCAHSRELSDESKNRRTNKLKQ